MHTNSDKRLIFSATDLSHFLACPHLSGLSRAVSTGERARPRVYPDPGLEALQRRGHEHEARFLAAYRDRGLNVHEVSIDGAEDMSYPERTVALAQATLAALRAGAHVVYQGVLFDGEWHGRPDFLVRVDAPSELGDFSYEVLDTKLAREAKGGALLQVMLYADLLAKVQDWMPEYVQLALAGPEPRTIPFRVAEYAAYFRSVRARFLEAMRQPADPDAVPEPAEHCTICDWTEHCDGVWRDVDHLSLVAGISRSHRRALVDVGADTLEALAALRPDTTVDGIGKVSLVRIREQARIQAHGRREQKPLHELIEPIEEGRGLALLPERSAGDLFFDLEADPFALDTGLEYLFGYADREGNYTSVWALDRAAEKKAFEEFIDLVMARWEEHPGMHVYHYAPYEPSALKRLMGRYGTREEEVDRLLRGERLVDLYRVVRQGVRASVESYSIKRMEPFYGFERAVDLPDANRARSYLEAWLELGGERDDPLLPIIEGYNRDDVLSTLRLAEWLERLRAEHEQRSGASIPRPVPGSGDPSEDQEARNEEVRALAERLVTDVPADVGERSPEQHARWLLAQLLEFHRREDRAAWWEYYRCHDLADEELIEDRATIGGITYDGPSGTVARSTLHRYRFAPQEHGLKAGDTVEAAGTKEALGKIVSIDDATSTFELKRGNGRPAPQPRGLVVNDIMKTTAQRQSLQRIAAAVLERGIDAGAGAAGELLLRRAPRAGQEPGSALQRDDETALEAALRVVHTLDRTVLPIQGPPGSGKTYTAARMIVAALKAGRRVGITATSHKVIGNLLENVCDAAREAGCDAKGIQKAEADQHCGRDEITCTNSNDQVVTALGSGEVRLAAGTAWLWSRPDMMNSVDLLFVDEAGQFSLANAVAIAPAANSLVLVGDPRQLEQPQQGVHPPGADVSAMDHLLDGTATIPPDRGLFLAETWRLHPDICAFTSEMFYDGRLHARPGRESQRIDGPSPIRGSGLIHVPVEHSGRQSESPEEARIVADLVRSLLEGSSYWHDHEDVRHPLALQDILIVSPYNLQVHALAQALPPGARVGTVDKFQGQQAPIVIYSMASSSAADAPRGMQFLFSPNRFNVATSRAKCLAVVVANPALFAADCRTPEQMKWANVFCRFGEVAGVVGS